MTSTYAGDENAIPRIGYLVWYECAQADVSYEALAHTIELNGFPPDLAPIANRKRAYHHAVRAYGREHYRMTVHRLPSSTKRFAHQITAMLDVHSGGERVYGFKAQVVTTFSRETEEVAVDPVGGDVSAETFRTDIDQHIRNYMRSVHVDVVRDWTRAMLARCGAVSARKSGGLHFVPVDQQQDLENLSAVLAELGSTLYTHPVYDTATWRQHAAGFVSDDLVSDFREMKNELDKIVAESRTTGEIKRYKLDTILGRFSALESKEGMYEDLLKMKLGDLQRGIGSVKRQIADLTLGKVKGIEAVDTAHEIRERQRAARRDEVAAEKAEEAAERDRLAAVVSEKLSSAKTRLEKKLLPVKESAERKPRQAVRQVVADKASDTPF